MFRNSRWKGQFNKHRGFCAFFVKKSTISILGLWGIYSQPGRIIKLSSSLPKRYDAQYNGPAKPRNVLQKQKNDMESFNILEAGICTRWISHRVANRMLVDATVTLVCKAFWRSKGQMRSNYVFVDFTHVLLSLLYSRQERMVWQNTKVRFSRNLFVTVYVCACTGEHCAIDIHWIK